MPLSQYGVLAGRAIDRRREGATDTPHYQIHMVDQGGTSFRIAVNVMSQQSPSELLFLVDDDFEHPSTTAVEALPSGWSPLPSQPGGAALDFIRANLVDRAAMRLLPPDLSGPDNDLADLLDHHVERVIADPSITVYAFGQRFGPENVPDKVFGFRPGNGVHDIHMNQGNSPRFARDDGVWQDGALLFHIPSESRWVAVFLAFQSQAFHTDDVTGHAIGAAEPVPGPGPTPVPTSGDGHVPVRILAAMVNPVGPAPEAESVLLLNASPGPLDLTGWRLADRTKRTCPVPGGVLDAGATLRVPMSDGVALGNKGGIITLLDPQGLKVDGVSYTEGAAGREGWTVTF